MAASRARQSRLWLRETGRAQGAHSCRPLTGFPSAGRRLPNRTRAVAPESSIPTAHRAALDNPGTWRHGNWRRRHSAIPGSIDEAAHRPRGIAYRTTPVATRDTVQSSVQHLLFQPSPADVPAFHDFSSLEIAFEYVWQEAIDEGILELAQDAYETIVELGGDPNRPEHQTIHPVRALVSEGGRSEGRSLGYPRSPRRGDLGPRDPRILD